MQIIYLLEHYFILFMIYNTIGWFFEEVVCTVGYKQLVNQGFLMGPYLPIYGCGAMLNLIVLGRLNNTFLIFISSILLTSVLEYLTSYLLELVFHARWWDYSRFRYQLHGRICLPGALAFGGLSVIELKIVQPFLEHYMNDFSSEATQGIAFFMFVLFFLDILVSAYRQYTKSEYYRFPFEN